MSSNPYNNFTNIEDFIQDFAEADANFIDDDEDDEDFQNQLDDLNNDLNHSNHQVGFEQEQEQPPQPLQAPHTRNNHCLVTKEMWYYFTNKLEKRSYYLSELVLSINLTFYPHLTLDNRKFAKLPYIKDSFVVERFNDKGKEKRIYKKI